MMEEKTTGNNNKHLTIVCDISTSNTLYVAFAAAPTKSRYHQNLTLK